MLFLLFTPKTNTFFPIADAIELPCNITAAMQQAVAAETTDHLLINEMLSNEIANHVQSTGTFANFYFLHLT